MSLRYLRNCKAPLAFGHSSEPEWDVFISAYNDTARVQVPFSKIHAKKKYWVALPEYHYKDDELPSSAEVLAFASGSSEAEVINDIINRHIGAESVRSLTVCIDITGFMRPHILYLTYYLKMLGISSFDMIYTEPDQYRRKEETKFASDVVLVRQVAGFEGIHTDDVANDILVVGVGYDDELISRLVDNKDSAKVIQMLSLPSLSADMYQESILRLDRTSLSIDPAMEDQVFFAPANDPFVVATELSNHIEHLRSRGPVNNIYLSPLATKAQAVGFALYFLAELTSEPASIVFPFSASYARETSKGVGRTWRYEITY